MYHIRIGNQVHDLSICILNLSERFLKLVIFRVSSCDLSPPLKPRVGGSSKVHKMSYTHPNLIPLVAMGSMRQEEAMGKIPY